MLYFQASRGLPLSLDLSEAIASFLLTTRLALAVLLGRDDTDGISCDTPVDVDGFGEASSPMGSSRSITMVGSNVVGSTVVGSTAVGFKRNRHFQIICKLNSPRMWEHASYIFRCYHKVRRKFPIAGFEIVSEQSESIEICSKCRLIRGGEKCE